MPSSQSENVSADILRTLHRIHRQLADLRERKQRGPRKLHNAEAHVAQCERNVHEVHEQDKALRIAADKKQLELKTSEGKILELKTKLNTAASNKEYQTLREQIEAVEAANSVLADEILEQLERVDQFQEQIAAAESTLQQAKQKAEQVRGEVGQQMPLVEGDITRLEAELQEAESSLPGEIKDLYHRVVRQRGEDALAALEGQTCSGCYTQMPLNDCNKLLLGQPMFCRQCGRMLYVPEDNTP
jgi:hypothetical protein